VQRDLVGGLEQSGQANRVVRRDRITQRRADRDRGLAFTHEPALASYSEADRMPSRRASEGTALGIIEVQRDLVGGLEQSGQPDHVVRRNLIAQSGRNQYGLIRAHARAGRCVIFRSGQNAIAIERPEGTALGIIEVQRDLVGGLEQSGQATASYDGI